MNQIPAYSVIVTSTNAKPIIGQLRWLADALERGEIEWRSGGLVINKHPKGYSVEADLRVYEVPENERPKAEDITDIIRCRRLEDRV